LLRPLPLLYAHRHLDHIGSVYTCLASRWGRALAADMSGDGRRDGMPH
jgi:hypothetical protein